MDRYLHSSVNRIIVFFAALVVAAWATSVTAQQYCGPYSVAQAVQVKFADCGDVPDNVSVYIDDTGGKLLPLTKAPSGYWEGDKKFEPAKQTLCSHTCGSASGCARFSRTVAIDRGQSFPVCAARYVIRCAEQAWNLHVDSEPGWLVNYKSLRQTRGGTKTLQEGARMTPFNLCDLAHDEHVELQLKVIEVYVPVKTIYAGLFHRGQTIEVNRDELVRRLQAARGTKRARPAEERKHLPDLVTFKIIDR
jgi:hypothetical protein